MCIHLHFFTRTWIMSGSRRTVLHAESSEASQLDTLPCYQRINHRRHKAAYHRFGLNLRKTCPRRDPVDNIRFRHES